MTTPPAHEGAGTVGFPAEKEARKMEGPVQRHRALYKGPPPGPPWKEAFRKRCMERLKSSRARLLERYRHLGGEAARRTSDNNLLVQEVMEAEWQALKSSNAPLPSLRKPDAFPQTSEDSELAILEEIQQELILQEQLVLEEYHQSLRFDEECLNAMLEDLEMGHRIICPVCRRDGLCVKSHLVACPCGVRIATQEMTEEKLRSLLEDAMTEHSQHCHYSPEFAVANGMERDANLLMSCRACDSWAIVL